MEEINLGDSFISLPSLGLNEISNYSLDTLLYEAEMASRNGGIHLSSLSASQDYFQDENEFSTDNYSKKDEEHYKKLVPHFKKSWELRTPKTLKNIFKKYKKIKSPCSMVINTLQEFEKHLLRAYQVSYSNYVLSIKSNTPFPSNSCESSSKNVMLSLMELGYPNASCALNKKYDHGYVILPFVISNNDLKGVIIVDPTSDQLWNNSEKKKRNMVRAVIGDTWEYITEWKAGANLYPEFILSLDILKKSNKKNPFSIDFIPLYRYHSDTGKFLNKAFSNAINTRNYL